MIIIDRHGTKNERMKLFDHFHYNGT